MRHITADERIFEIFKVRINKKIFWSQTVEFVQQKYIFYIEIHSNFFKKKVSKVA